MSEEVIAKLLSNGTICNAQVDSCFNVTFLTTQIEDEIGKPIEVILDDSGESVISIVGRISCYLNNTLNKTTLLQILWLINRTNEQIIDSEGVGTWVLNGENGDFLYCASTVNNSSSESLASFCEIALRTYIETRQLLTSTIAEQ